MITAAQTYVTTRFEQHPDPVLVYHNLVHTQQVVQAAEQIAAFYRLTEGDQLVVFLAAWFHDIGYLQGSRGNHEQTGADAARVFIGEQQLPESVAQAVADCILATRIPQTPKNLLEQIVCDADLFHLGSRDFNKRNKLLRAEMEMATGQAISGAEWTRTSIAFLESHYYHTAYCQTLLKQQKEENLAKLRTKLEKKENEASEAAIAIAKMPKVKKPERGVETMFRTTSTNHIRLSSMADSKAHIMITVNSIIISVLLSLLLRRLEDFPNFILPAVLFLTTSVVTIVFSVLATRPNITTGRFTDEDIRNKKANLLFFGNFHQMSYKDYEEGMETIMKNGEYLYSNMIHDIYNLGVVLGHKYRLLRIAYNTFMFGIIASVIAFTVAAIFFPIKG